MAALSELPDASLSSELSAACALSTKRAFFDGSSHRLPEHSSSSLDESIMLQVDHEKTFKIGIWIFSANLQLQINDPRYNITSEKQYGAQL
jgi:hypothetical protein